MWFRNFDSGLFSVIISFCQYFSLDNKYFILFECKLLFNGLFAAAGKELCTSFFLYSTDIQQESSIQNLSINYCIFYQKRLNLVEIRHDLCFCSNGLRSFRINYWMLYWLRLFTSDQYLTVQYLKKLLILKRPKSNLLSFLDITCSAYLIGILIQAEKNLINHSYQPNHT